jgi:hypothetical protein
MAQEVSVVHQLPDCIDAFVTDVTLAQEFARLRLLFQNQLVCVDRVFQAVPQCA